MVLGIVSFGDNLQITVWLVDSVDNFTTLEGDVETVYEFAKFNDVEDCLVEEVENKMNLSCVKSAFFFWAAFTQSITKR